MISVIIPAYNEEKYIVDTIKSVRSSDIPHEVIVVCNGCTDNTEVLAKGHADVIINLNDRGVSKARNAGANSARFHKLVFLDADTKLSKNVLKEILTADGIGTSRAGADSKNPFDHLYFFLKYLTQFLGTSCGLIYCDKLVFSKVGGFREDLDKFEDGLFIRNATAFTKFKVLPSQVYTSTRRLKKQGYLYVPLFWFKEKFFPSKKPYEPVR